MADKKEMTARTASVGADAGQSLTIKNTTIIPESHEEFNGESTFPKDFSEQFFDIGDPRFLPIISMPELYGTTYESKPAIIEGLLCVGTYLFAGAPKLGKSFLMLQLDYHVSTGTPLWAILCGRAPFYIWPWKMIIPDYKAAYTECSELTQRMVCIYPRGQSKSAPVWKNSWKASLPSIRMPG